MHVSYFWNVAPDGHPPKLLSEHRTLALEFHPSKNIINDVEGGPRQNNATMKSPRKSRVALPQDFAQSSQKEIWWQCVNGHAWLASVRSRVRALESQSTVIASDRNDIVGLKCTVCVAHEKLASSLAVRRPEIAALWHPTKNSNLSPEVLTPASNKDVWWKYKECGHEFYLSVNDLTKRKFPMACAKCKLLERNIAHQLPELALLWDYDKNHEMPDDVSVGSNTKFWWTDGKFVSPVSRASSFRRRSKMKMP